MRIRSWGGSVVTSSPKKRTRPAVGGKSPVTVLNSVVLPAPLAPMSARRSPAATVSETSSIALSAPKVRVTPSSTRASPVAIGVPLDGPAPVTAGGIVCLGRSLPGLLRAARDVARAEPDLVEVGLRHAEALVHVRGHLDHFVVKGAVGGLGDLGHERGAYALPVLVQHHVAGRRLELQPLQRLAVLGLAAGE